MNNSILVIDDEQDFLDSVKRGLIISGFRNVQLENDPLNVVAIFERGGTFDIALIDINMPSMDGIELLEFIKKTSPSTECLMVTGVNEASIAVKCVKRGAYDYLVKPVLRDDLVLAVGRALERKRLFDILDIEKKGPVPDLLNQDAFAPIVTVSADVLRILKEAELHAASDMPILITGESGTGKELLARAIHLASPRAESPFMPINMVSIAGNLFDAEFFGHTRGAFTGAEKDRSGYLEETNRGTLFLDEIGNLPLELQGKLLRVLQDGEYIKLGTNKLRKVDIRFIAATNADLDQLMNKGLFRKDMYYRLRGAWLHLPPLKERQDDIPVLISKILEEYCGDTGKTIIEEEVMSVLLNYDYPGNIRELRSILQSAVNLSQGRPISLKYLPRQLKSRSTSSRSEPQIGSGSVITLAEVEKTHILKVYEKTARNKSQTAKLLNIGLNTLRRKLELYGEG
jgi:two-component system response regulator AtoC